MIPAANRPYVRGSVMTLCIVVAITVSGVMRLVYPGAVSTSSALQQLPTALLLYLNLAWICSGAITSVGIVSGKRRVEASGLVLMTSAFLAYFVAILIYKGDAALSVFYIFGYAVGAALRARYLVSENMRLVAISGEERVSVPLRD